MPRGRLFRWVAVLWVGSLVAAVGAYYYWTNPAVVRHHVMAQLRKTFVGAEVELGSARFRLLGGITFTNLSLYRRDDPGQTPFLHVPAGVIYHDKEALSEGRFAIRKVHLDRPRLTVARGPNGDWNLVGVLGPVAPDVPVPIFVVEQGTVVFEDQGPEACPPQPLQRVSFPPPALSLTGPAPPSLPATAFRAEVRGVNATVLNDPLPVLNFQGRGTSPLLGPVQFQATLQRATGQFAGGLDLPAIPLGTALVRGVGRYAPGFADAVQEVSGTGSVHLDVRYKADGSPRLTHQVNVQVKDGHVVHRDVPLPLDAVEVTARCLDGQIVLDRFRARSGAATVAGRLRLRPEIGSPRPEGAVMQASVPPGRAPKSCPLPGVEALQMSVEHVTATSELYARLPEAARRFHQRFAPTGPMSLDVGMDGCGDGWTKRVVLRPEGMDGQYHKFPYPLHNVRGTLTIDGGDARSDFFTVDLAGEADDGKPVHVRGTVEGDGPEPAIALDVDGAGVPINEAVFRALRALPGKYEALARSFRPRGRVNVIGRIRHTAGSPKGNDRYLITFDDTSIHYDVFPYPLEGLTGVLDVTLAPGTAADPKAGDHFEFRDFRGGHNGGRVQINGYSKRTPAGDCVITELAGEGVALDGEMAAAFDKLKLRGVWDTFAPTGRMSFTARVEHTDRRDGGLPDLAVRVSPAGATVRPAFFPYALTNVAGTFEVAHDKVRLTSFHGRHTGTEFQLDGGVVSLRPSGFWADVRGLSIGPLTADRDFMVALPPALRQLIGGLKFDGPLGIGLNRLVVSTLPEANGTPALPQVWWDGGLALSGAALNTGVGWQGVEGQLACKGHFQGQRLEALTGNLLVGRAAVLGQPIGQIHADLLVDPSMPEVLQVHNLSARLFGGTVGGQARVAFGSALEYRLDLTASGMDLAEFGRLNRVGGGAELTGKAAAAFYLQGGANADELQGRGSIDVPSGRLYNLPLVLEMFKVMSLRPPDRTAFEEAHCAFQINGRRAKVERLDLLGNAISLGGQGEVNLDGTDAKIDFYAVWGRIAQALPAVLRNVPADVSQSLLKIEMRGSVAAPKFNAVTVPVIVEPVKRFLERVQGRTGPGGMPK